MLDLNSAYRAGKRLMRWLPAWLIRFRPFVVYEIPLGPGAATPAQDYSLPHVDCAPLPCRVSWIADAAEAAALRPLASQECVAAWNGGTRRAAAARLNGDAIACAWIATRTFDERDLGLNFELAADEAWLFSAVVAAEHRGHGVYRQLLEFVIADLRNAGARRLLFGVTVGNEPSRRAHARQCAVEIGRITALRTLGATFCRVTGRVRRLPSRRGASRSVELTVD